MNTSHTSTSGKLLVRNTVLNLLGQGMPLLVAFFAIPILVKSLGTDRFGIITIAWMLIGYLSLFDMGLGRALTQIIAEKLGKNEHEDIHCVFWTSMFLMLLFSIIGSLAFTILVSPLVHGILKIPIALQQETISSLYLLSFTIPFVILTAALVGFLSAYHRFDIINSIRIPMGIYNYVAPLIVLPFSSNLLSIISTLMVGRVVVFFVHLHYCLQTAPGLRSKIIIQKRMIKPLFSFGGWLTVSNIIGPFMVYFDRFLIGSLISVAAVAYYATPYEFITKLWIIPGALLNTLFPAFASTYAQEPATAVSLLSRSLKYLLLVIFPAVLVIVACAHDGLTLWLGSAFAANSYEVMQFLAIGIFINCLALAPFTFIQGIGKPHITSKFHILELVIYLPVLWFCVITYGIKGAAVAWTLRIALDTLLLLIAAKRLCRPFPVLSKMTGYMILAGIGTLSVLLVLHSPVPRYMVACTALTLFCYVGWKKLLSSDERLYLYESTTKIFMTLRH